jgi:hypothetical protein
MLGYSVWTGRSLFLSRYLTFAQLAWLAGVALAVTGLPRVAKWPVLAGLLALGCLYPLAQNWDCLGPRAAPGMRAAVGHLLACRGADEPVFVQGPLALPQAAYYARRHVRPLLYCRLPSRHALAQPAHLDDGDLVAYHRLLDEGRPAAWFICSSSYREPGRIVSPLPAGWQLDDRLEFPQDRFFEGSVLVYHYRAAGEGRPLPVAAARR